MPSPSIRALRADGARVHADKTAALDRVGLRLPAQHLTAICVGGIGVTAILLALSGRSTAPGLCIALALPAFAWAIRLYRIDRPGFGESLAFLTFCDAVIFTGLFVVTSTDVGFLKLTWLVAVSGYAYGFHGRLAMGVQVTILLLGVGVVLASALRHGDSSLGVLGAGTVTILVMNAATLLLIDLGPRRFGLSAERAERLARLDELTGLLNRRGLGHACQGWSGSMTVAMVDLDGFKRLNDTGGHAAGDEVLRRVARGLQAAAGPDALVARLGGDEFAVVGGHLPDLENRVRASFDGVPVGASIGVAEGISDGASALDAILASADAAMYEAKRTAGRRIA